jgi:hypothetical protein
VAPDAQHYADAPLEQGLTGIRPDTLRCLPRLLSCGPVNSGYGKRPGHEAGAAIESEDVMTKRDAKRIIYSFLVQHLDQAVIGEFVWDNSEGQQANCDRLFAAAEDIQFELRRRAGEEMD